MYRLKRSSRNARVSSPSSHESEAQAAALPCTTQSSSSSDDPEDELEVIPCKIQGGSTPILRKSSRL